MSGRAERATAATASATGDVGRIFAGATVAPLSLFVVMPVEMFVIDLLTGVSPALNGSAALSVSAAIVLVCYPVMLVIGVPVYLILRRWTRPLAWHAAVAGFFAPMTVPLLVWMSANPSLDTSGMRPGVLLGMVILGIPGAVVALVFWWLATSGLRAKDLPNSPGGTP